jgi:hypothetical protein
VNSKGGGETKMFGQAVPGAFPFMEYAQANLMEDAKRI